MRYRLFQVNEDRMRMVAFRPYDPQRPVAASDYHLTYQGEITGADDMAMLEGLFRQFNIDHPVDFASYSLSMADVVLLEDRVYYCDTFGWKRLDEAVIEGRFDA